jgi:hypothetical protein
VRRLSLAGDSWEDITPCSCTDLILTSPSHRVDFRNVFGGRVVMRDQGTPTTFNMFTADGGTSWSFSSSPLAITVLSGGILAGAGNPFSVRYLYSADLGRSWRSIGDSQERYSGTGPYPAGSLLIGETADALVFSRSNSLWGCPLE